MSAETPASTFAPKKIAPSVAGATPKRTWNHQATKACTTKPPANASRLKSPASRNTLPRERSRPSRGWRKDGRRESRSEGGGSTAGVSLRKSTAIAAPSTA